MTSKNSHIALLSIDEARIWAQVGVLAALAVVIGWVETFIPLPLPVAGAKLGLANIVIMVSLYLLGPRQAAVVALIKVLATGFLFGNPLMMLFSVAGTVLAFAAMAILMRIPGLSIVVISVVAAMLHNVGQLAVAQLVPGTPLVWYSAPFMLLIAVVTGSLCGLAANWTLEALEGEESHLRLLRTTHYAEIKQRDAKAEDHKSDAKAEGSNAHNLPEQHAYDNLPARRMRTSLRGDSTSARRRSIAKLLLLVVYLIVVFHAENPILLGIVALVAVAAAIATRVHIRAAVRVLVPLVFIVVFTIVMQIAYRQDGHVLASLGPIAITDQGIGASVRMVVAQLSAVIASIAFMRTMSRTELVDTFAWMAKPLTRLGVNADGLVLSLTVAMVFIPTLVKDFGALKAAHASRGVSFEGSVRARLKSYARLFAPLVRSSFRHADRLALSITARAF